MHEFGTSVEAALDAVEGKSKGEIEKKMQRVLTKWLDLPQQFRDPAASGVAIQPPKREEA